jgi:hypothetical protein
MLIDRARAKRYLALAGFTGSFLFILGVIALASALIKAGTRER